MKDNHMYLLQSWKESLTIFIPKNFKLFLLVTLKSLLETTKTFFRYFWWLIVLELGGPPLLNMLGVFTKMPSGDVANIVAFLTVFAQTITLFCLYLIARPSVAKKDYAYFKHYSYYVAIVFFIAFVCSLVVQMSLLYARVLLGSLLVPLLFLVMLPSALGAFFLLFWFDSDGTIKNLFYSFVRSIKMVLYNYPFCLIASLLFGGMWALVSVVPVQTFIFIYGAKLGILPLVVWPMLILRSIVRVLLFALQICFFTNFYVKRLHDQFTLYFPNKG